MTSGLSLVSIDEYPSKLAFTEPERIASFLENVMKLEALQASNALLSEMTVLNRQPLDVRTRIRVLEQYQHSLTEISAELADAYNHTKIPLPTEAREHAAVAEALWLEIGYGYKRALTDLKKELLSSNSKALNTLVIYRVLQALKHEASVKYLIYTLPSDSFWSDLHKVYYHALQLNLEDAVPEINHSNAGSISLLYKQILLMYLSNPQRLNKANILKMTDMIDELAKFARFRGLGLVEDPKGLFIVQLDKNEAPVAYNKNTHKPNIETDILLITVEVARQIHHQLTLIQQNQSTQIDSDEATRLQRDEPILKHLIEYLGDTPKRHYSRVSKAHSVELIFGFNNVHILFRKKKRAKKATTCEWQVQNIGPTGYALKNTDPSQQAADIHIGEIIAIADKETNTWSIGQIAWAHVTTINSNIDQLEVGVQLISPAGESVSYQAENLSGKAILLPEIDALQAKQSVLFEQAVPATTGTIMNLSNEDLSKQVRLESSTRKTAHFQQCEYSLINGDLS